jgi:hypothetical protein
MPIPQKIRYHNQIQFVIDILLEISKQEIEQLPVALIECYFEIIVHDSTQESNQEGNFVFILWQILSN